MSDTIAIGALRELTEHGIHVPDDVRLMGFDGIPFSACTNPPISTVAMDVPAMARTVIDRMVTLNESNLRHERPDDITHDHIQFRPLQELHNNNHRGARYEVLPGSAPLFQARQELNRLSLAYSHQRLGQDLFQD